jgi:hypothetical protein
VYVYGVYLNATRPPCTVVGYLKEESVANRPPITIDRRSFLLHFIAQARCNSFDGRANHFPRQGIAWPGPFAGTDMFRATLTHHLARVQRSATGARDAMGPGRSPMA